MAAGALPDGTPVTISGGDTVRRRRTADGAPLGPELRHTSVWIAATTTGRKGRPGEAAEGSPPGLPHPNGTSYDAMPAAWHQTATTNSAAFPNDAGTGTGAGRPAPAKRSPS